MIEYFNEAMLGTYFLLETVLGDNLPHGEAVRALGKVFCMSEEETARAEQLIAIKTVQEIRLYSDYKCYNRIQSYNRFIGSDSGFTELEKAVVAIKGAAIEEVKKNEIDFEKARGISTIYSELERLAQTGNVVAMKLIGIMLVEGLCVEKNYENGLVYLKRAAKWGDKASLLFVATYQEDEREANLTRLFTLVSGTPDKKYYSAAAKAYSFTLDKKSEEVSVLNKIFALGYVRPEIYNSSYASILYNPVISLKEKKRILMSGNPVLVSEICSIPMVFASEKLAVDESRISGMSLARAKEQAAIITNLRKVDLRFKRTYRAMCLCGDSEYLANRYIYALTKCFTDANVVTINVKDLQEKDIQFNGNHAFIRSLVAKNGNVIIFKMMGGGIHPAVRNAVREFLRSERRAKFGLISPEVTIDLSPVLPIVVCDEYNRDELETAMEVIRIEPVSDLEKDAALSEIVARKELTYSIGHIVVEDNAATRLKKYSCEVMETIVDAIAQEKKEQSANAH